MKLVGGPKCLCCRREEHPIHAFLECRNVTYLCRSIELWLRDTLNQHVQISGFDTIFGINNGDIFVNTVILEAKEFTYIKHKTGGTVSLLQIKRQLFSCRTEECWSSSK